METEDWILIMSTLRVEILHERFEMKAIINGDNIPIMSVKIGV
jgi:hypothetical protein